MNIPLDEIAAVLKENNLPPEMVAKINKDLVKVAEELKNDKANNADPKQKNQFVVILSSPEEIKEDLVSWVVQIPQDGDTGTVLTQIKDATKNFNEKTRKGKRKPCKTMGEAMEFVNRKFMKEQGILIKTKTPVRVLVTNNIL